MKNKYLIAMLVSLGLISVNSSYADNKNIVWSVNAMSCVPMPTAVQNDLITVQSGRVIFKTGKSGIASVICPIGTVSEKMNNIRSLILTYRDGDGNTSDSAGMVTANLRRVRRSNGAVETLPNSLVSSNSTTAPNSGPTGWATHQSATAGNTIPGGFEFDKFYYYVHITMKQRGTGPLAVMGVFLQN